MMRVRIVFVMVIVLAGSALPVTAQPANDTVPKSGTWTYTALNSTADCGYISGETTLEDKAGDLEFEWEFPVVVLEGGEQLVMAFAGDDFVFTRSAPGVYDGVMFNPSENASYESVLVVLDSETLSETATFRVGEDCVYTYENVYAWISEDMAELWSESERVFSNFTFRSCLGLVGQDEPSGTWINNDEIVPMTWPDDPLGLMIGTNLYVVDDTGFHYRTEDTIADSVHVYDTVLVPEGDDVYDKQFLYQIDGRDDCAVAYTSALVRLTEDDLADLIAE
jgi:hypothetical protein